MDYYRVIGLMSGSSLDGLDIAYCEFRVENGKWSFKILKTAIVEYPNEWTQEIKRLPVANAKTLWETHAAMGNYCGEKVNDTHRGGILSTQNGGWRDDFPLRFRQPDRGAIVISKEDFNASFRQKLSPLIAQ